MDQPSRKTTTVAPEGASGELRRSEGERTFTFWERLQIFAATWIGYLAVLFVGRSLRWEVFGRENYEAARNAGKSLILTFWHNEIFSAIWYWRKRGIVVMASQNFDGEYIARIIQMHGYGVARGSSSRRASRAVLEMIRASRQNRDTAVTPDGPRGPRHVVKPGTVLLAKATGASILCFHIAPARAWRFRRSWDRTEIPRPFSRAAVFVAPPIVVSPGAGDDEQTRKLAEVQATLDGLVERGEQWKRERA